ncbi:hypothetical protein CY0110_19352 [Crocosphaera chwakensis CCY0110]|uniref:Uncharacterized protein n=1 Tax=Crocosphaera chwakensis CCY0110 TaxID=391612 RepID=A3IJK2_9CHRO|nr:hypothetical protein CY0110_19352 [Crocosphaera chwakensis CCY0110]
MRLDWELKKLSRFVVRFCRFLLYNKLLENEQFD